MKRKLSLILAAITMLLLIIMPAPAGAAGGYPDMTGEYYMKANIGIYDLTGSQIDMYKAIMVHVTSMPTNSTMAGHIDAYEALSVRGAKITNGTGTVTAITLAEGSNTVTVTGNGNITVTMPDGVSAVATSGTSTVTNSPKSCAADGDTTVTVTGAGNFTLAVTRDYTTISTLIGTVGNGNHPRYTILGTQLYGTLADTTGTVTEAGNIIVGSTTIHITGAGTFKITLPYGVTGTVTSGTATIVDSPKALAAGAETTVDSGVTTGTATVALSARIGWVMSGSAVYNSALTDISYLTGVVNGFIILNPQTNAVLTFSHYLRGAQQ